MFSQKKKNHIWIFVCLALIIAIIAVVILIGTLRTGSEEENLRASLETRAEENDDRSVTEDTENSQTVEEENSESEKNNSENQFFQSYYLVKSDNNVVKIFFSDETGKLTELEETGIVYETLSTEDQSRFQEGVKVESRDDLNRLIMDYES